jgi:fatty-acyl-CoA synthase
LLSNSIAFFARARPAKAACIDLATGARLSYSELDSRAARMKTALQRLTGKTDLAGERIAVVARNSSDVVCLHVACRRAGAIFVPLNFRLSGPELGVLVRQAEPLLTLVHPDFDALAADIHAGSPRSQLSGFGPRDEFLRSTADATEIHRAAPVTGDTIVTLLFTSGTSGRPKGVMITEANAHATARNYALSVNLDASSVILCDMPLFHVVGLFTIAGSVLEAGGTLLLASHFDPQVTQARIADPKLRITHYFCVPQMAQMLRQAAGFDPAPFRKLRALQTGGASHPESAVRAWVRDRVRCVDGFGMTEAGTVLGMPPDDLALLRRKTGSVGVPAASIRVRLVDKSGRDVRIGEIGELWLSGPSITPGYWRDEPATRAAFSDGWLRTGDAAIRDTDGFFTLVDRWKDMFISGGENVYPAEVEAALSEMAGVLEVAVVGIADPKWGEVGSAYLVLSPQAQFAPDLVLAHCRQRLAGYKVPKEFHVVDALPRTASGKVRKDLLRGPRAASATRANTARR